jgi:aspartate beta-hydroxylase
MAPEADEPEADEPEADDELGFELWYQSSKALSGPLVDGEDLLVCRDDGVVLKVVDRDETRDARVYAKSNGLVTGVALDQEGDLYLCDVAMKAITTVMEDGEASKVVDNYEERPLMGPSSAAIDEEGVIFFTDSGAFGETSLSNPTGSLFSISGNERVLSPLLHQCLAHPSGVAVHGTGKEQVVYVAETARNRILRGVQMVNGVFHMAVFYQFSGGVGPTGISTDEAGNLYVVRADYGGSAPVGLLSIISARGTLLGEKIAPANGLTGVAVGSMESNPFVYLTEATTSAVYRIHRSEIPV